MGGSRVRAPFGWDAAAAAEEIGGKEGGRRGRGGRRWECMKEPAGRDVSLPYIFG